MTIPEKLKRRIQLLSDFNNEICSESYENENIPKEIILDATEIRNFCNVYNKSRTKRLFTMERKIYEESSKKLNEKYRKEGYVSRDTASELWKKHNEVKYRVSKASYSEFGTPFYNGIIRLIDQCD